MPVLFAEAGRKPGQMLGKTPWLQSVFVEGGPEMIGRLADVRLVAAHPLSLAGEVVVGEADGRSVGVAA